MADFPWIDVFIIIFIGMGPVKVLLVYIEATQGVDTGVQRAVARRAVTTAVAVGLLLLVAGVVFMRILHFSTEALTIAGGLILLLLALSIVLSPAEKQASGEATDEAALMSMAIYPMGIPLLLNPVGIVALTVFSAETQEFVALGIIAAMILAIGLLDYGVFLVSHRLDRFLTHERILVLEKVLGILLAALAVQMLLNGLSAAGVFALSSGGH